jgi:anti-sigma factor RsiW
MRCEEVPQHQALDMLDPDVRAALHAHVAGCEACRNTGLLFAKIDASLKAAPVWVPSRHFAQRIVAQAVPAKVEPVPTSFWGSVTLGISTVAAVWSVGLTTKTYPQWSVDLSQALVANSNTLVWTSMGLSLGVAAWFTRRALR